MKIQLKVKIDNHKINEVLEVAPRIAAAMVRNGKAVHYIGEKELKPNNQTKENKQARNRKTK